MNLEETNLNNLCHFCLKKTKKLKSLFGKTSNLSDFGEKDYLCVIDFMSLITNFKIMDGNEYPKFFCTQCAKQINNFMIFRLNCIKSIEQIGKIKVKNDTPIKEELVEIHIPDGKSNLCAIEHVEKTETFDEFEEHTVSNEPSNDQDVKKLHLQHSIATKPPLSISRSRRKTTTKKSNMVEQLSESGEESDADYDFDKDSGSDEECEEKRKSNKEEKGSSIKILPEPTICMFCGGSYRYIQQHIKSHSEERPFACDYCDKRFKAKAILKSHLNIHLNLRSHVCDICGKGFNNPKGLKLHLITHAGVRKEECNICGMKFVLKTSLRNHILTHRQNRRYECSECGKKFLTKTEHTQHSWVHTGEKPHPCKICDKRFRTAGMRRVHELHVHRDIFKKEPNVNSIRCQSKHQKTEDST